MKRNLSYLKYVIRHKWFVFIAARKVGCSLWLALIHDLSKFLPSEWRPYAETFYYPDGSSRYCETSAFNRAWNLHQKRNKHHWQFWVLQCDNGNVKALTMPYEYAREMVADWMGAGRAITGKWEVCEWYDMNKEKMVLNEETRVYVEAALLSRFRELPK